MSRMQKLKKRLAEKKQNQMPMTENKNFSSIELNNIMADMFKCGPTIDELKLNIDKVWAQTRFIQENLETVNKKDFGKLLEQYKKTKAILIELSNEEKFPRKIVNMMLLNKFKLLTDSEIKKIDKIDIMEFSALNFLLDLFAFYQAQISSRECVVNAKKDFYEELLKIAPNKKPFDLQKTIHQRLKYEIATLIIVYNLPDDKQQGVPVIREIIKNPLDKKIERKCLIVLLVYLNEIYPNLSSPKEKSNIVLELKDCVKKIEEEKTNNALEHYNLGHAYRILYEKYKAVKEYAKLAFDHYKEAVEIKTDLDDGYLFHYERAMYFIGNNYYYGLPGYLSINISKAKYYFEKTSSTTDAGKSAKNMLLICKFKMLEMESTEYKQIEKTWNDPAFQSVAAIMKLVLLPAVSAPKYQQYFNKLEERMTNLKPWFDEEPIYYQKVATNCKVFHDFNPVKYPKAKFYYKKYSEAAQKAQQRLDETGEIYAKLLDSSDSEAICHLEILSKLVDEYKSTYQSVFEDEKIIAQEIIAEYKLPSNIKIIKSPLMLFHQLSKLNIQDKGFSYKLHQSLPELSQLIMDLVYLIEDSDIDYLLKNKIITLVCSLPISAESKTLTKFLQKVTLHLKYNFESDITPPNDLVRIIYQFAMIGYQFDLDFINIAQKKWEQLSIKHKFLLFYSLFLFHVQARNQSAVRCEILSAVTKISKLLNNFQVNKDFIKKEFIYAMQVARAYAYFSTLKEKVNLTPVARSIKTLWQSFQELGIKYQLDPYESKMQIKVENWLKKFYKDEIYTEHEIKHSTVIVDLVIPEFRVAVHVEGLTHYHFLLPANKNQKGQLIETPKTKSRNLICSQSEYGFKKQVSINFEEVNTCSSSGKEDEPILWFDLFHQKFKPYFLLGLDDYAPPPTLTANKSRLMGTHCVEIKNKIKPNDLILYTQTQVENLQKSNAPNHVKLAFKTFQVEAEKSYPKNKAPLTYLAERLEKCLEKYPVSVKVLTQKNIIGLAR